MFDWLLQSLEYCADSLELERKNETLMLFYNVAIVSEGCTALLQCGASEKLCRMLNQDGDNEEIVSSALLTLGRLACEGRHVIDSLIERGVFATVFRYGAQMFERAVIVGAAVPIALLHTMSFLLDAADPPLPFRVTEPILPLLFFALQNFHGNPMLADAYTSAVSMLAAIFREESEGVRFEALVSGGIDIVSLVGGTIFMRSHALDLVRQVAAVTGDGDVSARIFTPPALLHLQRLAMSLEPDEFSELTKLIRTLANLQAKGPEMAARVFASEALQTLIPRVAVPPHTGDMRRPEWRVAVMLSSLMRDALAAAPTDKGGNVADVAHALLESGALLYLAQTLSAAAAISMAPSLERLYTAVRLMIQAGDTSADPAVLVEGAVPRNVFLAAFFDAGGRDALSKLRRKQKSCTDEREEAIRLDQLLVDIVGDLTHDDAVPQPKER